MPGADVISLVGRNRRTVPRRLLKKALLDEQVRGDIDARLLARVDAERPRYRADCRGGVRPCPYVSCRHHLFLDVNPENGSVRFNYPGAAVGDLPETCALDVAEAGGRTLEEIGRLLNLTRERVRQVECHGLVKIRRGLAD